MSANAKRAGKVFAMLGKSVKRGKYLVRVPHDSPVAFGSGLKAARELAGLSLREVEAATGISNAYVCQLEGNQVRRPAVFILAKLANLYGIDCGRLLASLPDVPPMIGEVKAVAWKWLPPPQNEAEQVEMANYLKLIRARERGVEDTNRLGGKHNPEGRRLQKS